MKNNFYWGDLHNHNEIGYGVGSLERSFSIAHNALDFYGFTPHAYWPDLPADDPQTVAYHNRGFDKTATNWGRVRNLVSDYNVENEFVTFLAYEWHSNKWGDYCVYYPDENGEICRAPDLKNLQAFARSHNCFILPHHVGYFPNCRSLNWEELDATLSPVIEIFSEHGNSLEYYSHKSMFSHSMGGVCKQQTVMENLKKGIQVGFISDTDDHCGYPGNYGEGLTCIVARNLDRETLVNALRARHCYAVTGDRIEVDLCANGSYMMGDIIDTDFLELDFRIKGQCPIKMVTLFKNSVPVEFWTPYRCNVSEPKGRLLKLEWGWDCFAPGQKREALTKWIHELEINGAEIRNVYPCLCGGDGSVVEENRYHFADNKVSVSSFTSRANIAPVSGIVLELSDGDGGELNFFAKAERKGQGYEIEKTIPLSGLVDCDLHIPLFDCFSAPKVKVHSLVEAEQYQLAGDYQLDVKEGDYFILKVEQENGHMAWTSPVFIT